MAKDEQAFRKLLDERGVLVPGALEPPGRHAAYAVFGQRRDAALDVAALRGQAARFFDAKLGLTVDKRYLGAPKVDAAHVVLATNDGEVAGTRLAYGRPADVDDVAAAESAERLQGTTGMALLAQRCGVVWLVVAEREDGADDPVALTIAAIFASVLLGPILVPSGDALLGVRSARERLAG